MSEPAPDSSVAAPAPPAASPAVRVPVWDLPVRLFHWTLVALVAGLVATGLLGGDWLAWHMRMGQAVIVLVLFRVSWGFAGSGNARFAAFLRGPQAVLRYARSLVVPPHEVHATHNPLGGWMVIALLGALAIQAGTGLFTNDDILWDGPLVQRVAKETSDAISSIHRRFWWVVVALVALHVLAVGAYRAILKDDLVAPMVRGWKALPPQSASPADAQGSGLRAVVLVTVIALCVYYVLHRL